jgi:hypothetical protein
MTGEMPRSMRNCPSAVPGANTIATPTSTGVTLTITASGPEAQRQIHALAGLHATLQAPIWGMPDHTGMHTGPGTVGHCPIIHAGTTITYEETPNGALHRGAFAERGQAPADRDRSPHPHARRAIELAQRDARAFAGRRQRADTRRG